MNKSPVLYSLYPITYQLTNGCLRDTQKNVDSLPLHCTPRSWLAACGTGPGKHTGQTLWPAEPRCLAGPSKHHTQANFGPSQWRPKERWCLVFGGPRKESEATKNMNLTATEPYASAQSVSQLFMLRSLRVFTNNIHKYKSIIHLFSCIGTLHSTWEGSHLPKVVNGPLHRAWLQSPNLCDAPLCPGIRTRCKEGQDATGSEGNDN